MEIGIKNTKTLAVTPENTAAALGSGLLSVFATPAMIALMEQTAAESVQGQLEDGGCTVGTSLDVKHISATPVGMTVRVESTLTAIDGRKLTFEVTAFDEAGQIGYGTHERFIVASERFMEKAQRKLEH